MAVDLWVGLEVWLRWSAYGDSYFSFLIDPLYSVAAQALWQRIAPHRLS